MPAAIQSRASTPAIPPARTSLVGLGLSVEGMRSNLAASVVLAAVKLVIMHGLCVASSLNPLYTIAAVVCAAKTVYILAGEYKMEEPLVAATVSITTLLSVATLLGWLYALSRRAKTPRRNGTVCTDHPRLPWKMRHARHLRGEHHDRALFLS